MQPFPELQQLRMGPGTTLTNNSNTLEVTARVRLAQAKKKKKNKGYKKYSVISLVSNSRMLAIFSKLK